MEKLDFRAMTSDEGLLRSTLEDYGAVFTGRNSFKCPVHEDKNASAGMFRKDGHWRYKCQGCEWSGDVVDLYKLLGKGVEKREPRKQPPPAQKKPITQEEAMAQLERHGEIVTGYKYENTDGSVSFNIVRMIDEHGGKVIRPVTPIDGGYHLSVPEAPRILYNLPKVLKADTVVVVEGEKCADSLNERGYTATTSSLGSKNAGHTDWSPVAGKEIIIWPDCDEDGEKYATRVKEILNKLDPKPTVSMINPSELGLVNKEDVYDFIEQCKTVKSNVKEELDQAIGKAKGDGLASKMLKKVTKIRKGLYRAAKYPFPALTGLTQSLIPHTMTVFCGNPGATKSLTLLQMLRYWHDNKEDAICLMLERDKEYHTDRFMAQEYNNPDITNTEWQNENTEVYENYISQNQTTLNAFDKYIEMAPQTITLIQVHEWIDKKAKSGARIICVDPVTIAQKSDKGWMDDERFVSNLRATLNVYGCSVFLVTHPIKMMTTPDMSMLSGGAAYSRFADTIIWLESHDDKCKQVKSSLGTIATNYDRTMHILKSRDGSGHGRKLAYRFNLDNLTITELGVIVKDK